jgi:hypothetical protein
MDKIRSTRLFVLAVIIIGLAMRAFYILKYAMLDSDTAVFALMAKHILELKEFPIYMWKAHYAGTLSCYLGALLFKVFGVSITVYSLVKVILACFLVLSNFILARETLDRRGYIAGLLLIVMPSAWTIRYSLLEGLSEVLIFGSLLLWLSMRWNKAEARQGVMFCPVMGLLTGLGLWAQPAFMPFAITAIAVFFIKDRRFIFSRGFIYFTAGFIVGYMPGIIYAVQYPGASFFRFAGRVLDLDRSVLSAPNMAHIIFSKMAWRISTIPSSLSSIPYLLSGLAGAIGAFIFLAALLWVIVKRELFSEKGRLSDLGILTLFVACFAIFFSVFVGRGDPRYMLPLAAVLPIFIGKLFSDIGARNLAISLAVVAIILLSNYYGTGRALAAQPEHHYKELADWLGSKNIRYAYSDYWTAYPVVFESKEKVLVSPTLFSRTYDERYPEYTDNIRGAGQGAFIIDKSSCPLAQAEMERQLISSGTSYRRDALEEFVILHGFSRKILPEEFIFSNMGRAE